VTSATRAKEQLLGRLDGKVTVVTGGGRGIGRGICRRFAREGATVIVADSDKDFGQKAASELEALGGRGVFVWTDVTERASVEHLVASAHEIGQRLDVMVSNAIALAPHVALEDKTDAMFAFNLDICLYATLWAMQAAFPIMRAQGGGRIINLYSADADTGMWFHSDYNSAKGAVRALTVSGAAEWGRYNILCNAISPIAGTTVYNEKLKHLPEIQTLVATFPLGRIGDPEHDIAPVALFLATEDSQYVNGQTIYVDGGMPLSRGAVYPQDHQSEVDAWLVKRASLDTE
jgi:NAD(P)-dependent dehydrogenase (short-subunit alcohol dehydrogenase family)